jgi:hypothetical protein
VLDLAEEEEVDRRLALAPAAIMEKSNKGKINGRPPAKMVCQ